MGFFSKRFSDDILLKASIVAMCLSYLSLVSLVYIVDGVIEPVCVAAELCQQPGPAVFGDDPHGHVWRPAQHHC